MYSPKLYLCAKLLPNRTFSATSACREVIRFQNSDEFVKKVFVNNDKPVIIDFHADWFEPCKTFTQQLEIQITPRNDLALAVVKIEEHEDLLEAFEIMAVPTILGVKDNMVVQKLTGVVDDDKVKHLINLITSNEPGSETRKPEKIK